MRAFAAAISGYNEQTVKLTGGLEGTGVCFPRSASYLQQFEAMRAQDGARRLLADLPLRCPGPRAQTVSAEAVLTNNATLVHPLQDLGDEIIEDLREAAAAFDDPDVWFPGIDDGIEPVPDDHVALVMWAMQRELLRELRPPAGGGARLPAMPLADLPFRVQRALAERRRWHFARYGIRRPQWESGRWSLWDVEPDTDWVPRRALRLYGGTE